MAGDGTLRRLTPEALRDRAAEKDRAGQAALEAGDARAAAVAFNQANLLRLAASEMERLGRESLRSAPKPLRSRERSGKLGAPMYTPEQRLNMTRGYSEEAERLAEMGRAQDPPLTLAGIAEKGGISRSLLTMALKGDRSMPRAAGLKIQAATGYPLAAWKRLS